MPNKYVPQDLEMGDMVEVFVYTDSEDRPIATTLDPKIKMDRFAFLKVVDVNQYGAFLDWGMEKDLLLPFSEQQFDVEATKRYLVFMYKDQVTNRLVATTKFGKYIKKNKLELNIGEKVSLLVSGESEIGFKVIVNDLHYGMVFKTNYIKPFR